MLQDLGLFLSLEVLLKSVDVLVLISLRHTLFGEFVLVIRRPTILGVKVQICSICFSFSRLYSSFFSLTLLNQSCERSCTLTWELGERTLTRFGSACTR